MPHKEKPSRTILDEFHYRGSRSAVGAEGRFSKFCLTHFLSLLVLCGLVSFFTCNDVLAIGLSRAEIESGYSNNITYWEGMITGADSEDASCWIGYVNGSANQYYSYTKEENTYCYQNSQHKTSYKIAYDPSIPLCSVCNDSTDASDLYCTPYYNGIILYFGTETTPYCNMYSGAMTAAQGMCEGAPGTCCSVCGHQMILNVTPTAEGSLTLRTVCQLPEKPLFLHVEGYVQYVENPQNIHNVVLNGVLPNYVQGVFVRWDIPISIQCGDTITLTPSAAELAAIVFTYIHVVYEHECYDNDGDGYYANSASCPGGNDCDDNDPTVYPGATVSCYGGPSWTKNIGICKGGTKTCVNGQWSACTGQVLPASEICDDGLDNNCNNMVDEGCDKPCKDDDECCKSKYEVKISSSVNMVTGNLSHTQTLYKTVKAVLPLDLNLTYNSVEGDGILGNGWTHSYNMSVSQSDSGAYIHTDANAKKTALYLNGTQYKPLNAEYPSMTINPDNTYTLRQDENTVYTFNFSGKVTGIQDRFSNTITFTYTGNKLTGIADSQGRAISLVYNAANRIESIIDPNNNIHSFRYENNNLVNVFTMTTDQKTLTWTYTYTPQGQMQTKTTPMGYTITYVYEYNRLSQVTDNENKTRSLSFDPTTGASGISAGDDGQWVYQYDTATGKLAAKIDPEGYTTTYAYGTNTETVTDAKGNITEYVYDSKKNLLSMTEKSATDPVGRITVYTYNSDNEILTMIDPENHQTTYTYETIDGEKIVKLKDAADEETETRYYADGRLRWIINPKGQKTETVYAYDNVTHMTTEVTTDFLGVSTGRIYDISGNMIESRDAFGTVTTYEYNSLNQLNAVKNYHDSVMNTYDYYRDGNLKTVTDAYGNPTQYKYNYDGKITEVKDALGNTTAYVYGGGAGCASCGGSKDNLALVTDANNKTTSYEYYKNGWKKNQKDPLNHVTSYTYDPTGFMTSLTDPALAVTAFDKTDLVTTKTDPLGRVTTYVYDKAGRLKTKTDRKGDVINYSYTPDNVLQTITYPDNSTVSFTNDELDRTTSMTDSLGTTTYLYDDANRTVTVTDPHGFVVVYKNNEAGRLKELTYPGSKKVIYGYNLLNRVETVRLDWLNQTATYHYDTAGRLASLTNFNGTVTTLGYDNANRLTSLENRKTNSSIISSYSFPILDGVGNRMQAEINEPLMPALNPESTAYSYNEKKNRLMSAISDQQSAFNYDNEGQLAGVNDDVFTFDYEHRLTMAAISGQQSAFSYDGKGNRLKAIRNGQTTYYIHDLNNNVLAESDGNMNITKLYVHGQGLLGMVTPTDNVYSYHFNAIGSTVAMTDQSQNVVNKYAYNSFGALLNQVEAVPQSFKYVGQYGVMAEANGFNYMRARYQDPKTGRFVSEDPIGFEGGTVNLYEYVGNQPVNRIDPQGLIPIPAVIAACMANPACSSALLAGGAAAAAALAKLIENIGVPSEPMPLPDLSNTPERCRIDYEWCKSDAEHAECSELTRNAKIALCWAKFLLCLWGAAL